MLLLFLLRLKKEKEKRRLFFPPEGGKHNLTSRPISFPKMIVMIVLINSISDLEVISFLPSLDSTVSNEAELH